MVEMPDGKTMEEEVRGSLKSVDSSKAVEPDGIHRTIVKPLLEVLRKPRTQLFKASLAEQRFSADWLTSIVTPEHNTGGRDICDSYRSASLTSFVLKTLGKMLRDRLVNHL